MLLMEWYNGCYVRVREPLPARSTSWRAQKKEDANDA